MRPDTDPSVSIDAIYEAGIDPSRWTTALNKVARAVKADGSSIVVQDRVMQTVWSIIAGSQVVVSQACYSCAAVNPLWPATLMAPTGAILVDPVAAGREAYERNKSSLCLPPDLISVAAVKVLHDPPMSGVVTVVRGRFSALFAEEDVSVLRLLAPHLQRAVQINQRLAQFEGERASLIEVLERSPQGVLLLDANAQILFASRAAQAILSAGDGLKAVSDFLVAATSRDTAALRRLLAQAASGNGIDTGGSHLAIQRSASQRPLSLLIAPLRGATAWLVRPAARAIVFLTDPDALPPISAEQLRRLYGLTAAEAAVTIAALHGEGVSAVADGLGISVATARTHLHRVFEKTGTQRQAELVRLILNSHCGH